jgi:hypothetical protein
MTSRCNGRSRSPGGRHLRPCLAASLALLLVAGGCDRKPLVQIRTERITPPEELLNCPGDKPQPPSVAQIAGPDGDNQLAIYVARLDAWGKGRDACLGDIRKWATGATPNP